VNTALSPKWLAQAHADSGQDPALALETAEQLSGLGPEEFLKTLGAQLRLTAFLLPQLRELEPAFDLLPFSRCIERDCVAVRSEQGHAWLIIPNPFDAALVEWAIQTIQAPFQLGLARREDLVAFLNVLESGTKAMDAVQIVADGEGLGQSAEEVSLKAISADASPVVRLVRSTLYDALVANASDIHLENDSQGLTIRYRIDGVLTRVTHTSGKELSEQVISRIKVMAELDISERRVPQDGRFKVRARGREVDFRVSIMPGVFGEDAVLRILDRQQLADALAGVTLDRLGFAEATLAAIRKLSREPFGMVLVTGPTGSGKTTTLYAALTEINSGHDKIITIEDPVEYQIAGILQIPVNEKKGLTFSRGLRSILRHDPDKIMVGEIRDLETAQIAVQSALTGHLVFTTVHANTVFDVIGRFIHMGVDPASFVSALNGVLAQRLVRLNCPHCVRQDRPSQESVALSGLHNRDISHFKFQAGAGCGQCRGTGYLGRKAIAELLILTDEIRELIATRAPIRQIKQAAQARGMRSLRDCAVDLVANGETTLEEINRVTFAE
jgi:general secretion pathway protein E